MINLYRVLIGISTYLNKINVMSKLLISCVIPTYNTGLLLKGCVESLLGQTYQNIEIIIVDDYSNDSTTLDIIRYYEHNFKRVLSVKPIQKGANYARAKGVAIAKGDFVTFLDSDDKLDRNAITKLYQSIIKYEADIAIGKLVRVNAKGEILNNNLTPVPFNTPYLDIIPKTLIEYYNYLKPTLCGKLYKKEIFDDIPVENPPFFQDWNFTYKILSKINRISFIDEGIYLYLFLENSHASVTTTENKCKIYEAFISINGILDYYKAQSKFTEFNQFLQLVTLAFIKNLMGRGIFLDTRSDRKNLYKVSKKL
jgi:glycosyltransferase involved in cell wall biosynthesis